MILFFSIKAMGTETYICGYYQPDIYECRLISDEEDRVDTGKESAELDNDYVKEDFKRFSSF
jgi:hypothetical protein